jgi:transcription antitermination factor NusG
VLKIFGAAGGESAPAKIKIDFGVNDKVKIKEGPFENFDGVVESVDDEKALPSA